MIWWFMIFPSSNFPFNLDKDIQLDALSTISAFSRFRLFVLYFSFFNN